MSTPDAATLPADASDALWTADSERPAPEAVEAAPDNPPTPEPPAETAEEAAARDEAGRFAKGGKKAGNPRHDLNARLGQKAEEARLEKERADRLEAELQRVRAEHQAAPQSAKPSQPPADKFAFDPYDAYLASHPNATWEDWELARMEAFTDWRDQKREHQRTTEQTQFQTQQLQRAAYARYEALPTKYPDFPQAQQQADAFLASHGVGAFPPAIISAVHSSDRSDDLTYFLATHPEEALQLAREAAASGPDAAPFIRRYLEAQVPARAATESAASVRPSAARPPITRVGGTASATPVDPDDLDFGPEYIRQGNSRDRKQREASRW